MRGIAQAIDLVVVTPKQVEEYRNSPFSVVYPAMREGKVVYERNGRRITRMNGSTGHGILALAHDKRTPHQG